MNTEHPDGGFGSAPVPVLELQGVCVDVDTDDGWVRIVDGVDLVLGHGETVGLVGESGCGKTMTSLAVMGLLPENARMGGDVLLEGTSLRSLSKRELDRFRGADISMIFQEPRRSLNPAFTVGEQVAESVRHHRGVSRAEAWKRVIELFDLVEISDASRRARSYPHEFSGGMCQRVMLAIALACEPKVLIADEPTTALDVTVQRQVLELIIGLQERVGLAMLLITHDLGVVAEMCDRAAVMYAGQIVEATSTTALFDEPRHPYAAGLIDSTPDPNSHSRTLGEIPGIVPAPGSFPAGCRFHPRCPFAVPGRCDVGEHELEQIDMSTHLARCVRWNEIEPRGAFHV